MKCLYCGKWLGVDDPVDEHIHFCNLDECLGNYITVQIFKAKEEIRRMNR